MTRWMVVADIWWLPPQKLQKGENAIQFAERVKGMISSTAGLKNLSWDGYLKNYMAAKDQSKLRKKTQISYGSSFTYRIGKSYQSPETSPVILPNELKVSDKKDQKVNSEEYPQWFSLETVIDVKNKLLKTTADVSNRELPTSISSHSIIEKIMIAKDDVTRLWQADLPPKND